MLVQCSPESDTVGMGKIVQGTAMVRFCLIVRITRNIAFHCLSEISSRIIILYNFYFFNFKFIVNVMDL